MDKRHLDEHFFEKSVCLPKESLKEARLLKKKLRIECTDGMFTIKQSLLLATDFLQ